MKLPVDPKKQFSKKLAGRAEWFWFIYLILLLAALTYEPETATAIICLSLIVTVVMVVSVLSYTDNSKFEKALFTMRELKLHKFPSFSKKDNDDDDSDEEGDDNG